MDNFFLKKKYTLVNDNTTIKKISYVFLSFIVLDFLFIDFISYVTELDIFHEGTTLVPPLNLSLIPI